MAIRLTTSTLNSMRGNTSLFTKIAVENDLNTIETVRRWMRENRNNGPLTSVANIRIISEAINVTESKIVEEVSNETNCKRMPDFVPIGPGPVS